MKNKYSIIIITILVVFKSISSQGQLADSIVAMNNYPLGSLYFCKINIANGGFTNHQLISNGVSSLQSSCINYITKEYYFFEGQNLTAIDAVTGNIVSTINLPLAPTATFRCLKFNPCDSCIYGIVYDAPNYSFAKYNPWIGVINNIIGLAPTATPCWGCMSVLDPDSSLLTFDTGNGIVGLDLLTGNMRYGNLKVNLPNETFGHIALKCSTHEIIGTSANVNAGVKYLSKIDPYTGIVTHISTTGWNVGIWKPGGGGDCINQLTGDYFYSGAGSLLVRANTISGNMISNHAISLGELYYIDHFSTCQCSTKSSIEVNDLNSKIEFTFNQFSDEFSIHSSSNKICNITLYDIASRKILQNKFENSFVINTSQLARGIYIYHIQDKSGSSFTGKFVKY